MPSPPVYFCIRLYRNLIHHPSQRRNNESIFRRLFDSAQTSFPPDIYLSIGNVDAG